MPTLVLAKGKQQSRSAGGTNRPPSVRARAVTSAPPAPPDALLPLAASQRNLFTCTPLDNLHDKVLISSYLEQHAYWRSRPHYNLAHQKHSALQKGRQ